MLPKDVIHQFTGLSEIHEFAVMLFETEFNPFAEIHNARFGWVAGF